MEAEAAIDDPDGGELSETEIDDVPLASSSRSSSIVFQVFFHHLPDCLPL